MKDGRVRGLDRERLKLEVRRAAGPSVALLALVVASIASLAVILSNIGVKPPWSSSYHARVAVDDAAGVVAKKQTVRLAGIEIGRIDKVAIDGAGHAVLSIALDPDHAPLYHDARLRLRPETPLDDEFLDIESRGTPAAGKLGSDEVLQAERTRVAVDIGRVLDVFNANTRTRVKASIDALGEGLGDHGAQFREALVALAPFLHAARRLTHELAVRRGRTARLVHNFRLVTEELARREGEVRRLVRGGAVVFGELGGSAASVREVLAELPPTMTRLQSAFAAVRATADDLDPAFTDLQPVAGALPSGLRALARFSTGARPAFAALRDPLPALRSLLTRLRPTAGGLRRSFAALKPVPRRLDTTTRLIRPCEKPLSKFFQNTISLGKFSDQHSVILRGQTVVGANSAAGVANDPNQTAAPSCAPGGP